ncbi:facilitated trehalose transporter Tret1-2 homolog isoform X2 [Contarinia nasturtii]|uniref:facilitated trehalose transporter Tret1-2 homolog isoform X2 n=1 Tax=Contarinia nasturtii TaxID=265458 RepID=UPI0012D3D070|nr:facilitated trehalose transporter Tret1-2 homolog isoform X2 [Contarinia nasturtii]
MTKSANVEISDQICQPKISRFRVILPQVVAATVENMYLVGMGLIFALQTISIAALTGNANESNENEFLFISAEQATWIGSISFLCVPMGSLISIFLLAMLFGKYLRDLYSLDWPWVEWMHQPQLISEKYDSRIPTIADAESALRWLRGWVASEAVAQELHSLQRHMEHTKSCNECIKQKVKCAHSTPTMIEKLAELKRKPTLKPFFIVITMFLFATISGSFSMRAFIVQIFKAYKIPIQPDEAATIMGFLDNIGSLTVILIVRLTGKRRIYLTVAFGIVVCSMILSCFGFVYLPSGYNSFDQAHESVHLENLAYIPLICLMSWSFLSYCGYYSIPWMLMSEMFPFKSRGIACGFLSAFNCIFGFVTRKTYYNLELSLSLPGVSLFYAVVTGVAFILMYFILPETENYSLEDIELHFSDNSKRITDHKIAKTKNVDFECN